MFDPNIPLATIRELQIYFDGWSHRILDKVESETSRIEKSVDRLIESMKIIDARVDILEGERDKNLKMPATVDKHEEEIQQLQTWRAEVDTHPGLLQRLGDLEKWQIRQVAAGAALGSAITFAGYVLTQIVPTLLRTGKFP